MDNLCHSLAGAALAEAGLKRYTGRAMSTLIIASNLPDVDVAVFATDTLAMSFRRGWTHGALALVVLPAVFAGGMYAWDRLAGSKVAKGTKVTKDTEDAKGVDARAVNLSGLLLLSYIGVWLHVFMDFLNTYGVRLLMPFSDRWFYGDALYIVDPILYALFVAAIVLARRPVWRGVEPRRVARGALAVAAVYVTLMLVSNVWARTVVRSGLDRAGRPAGTRFMVTPVFANPIKREVIVDVGPRYEKGFLWFDPLPHFRPAGYGVDKNNDAPAAQAAARTERGAAYLRWSRFPFFVITPTEAGTRVYLSDYRYSGPGLTGSWATVAIPLRAAR